MLRLWKNFYEILKDMKVPNESRIEHFAPFFFISQRKRYKTRSQMNPIYNYPSCLPNIRFNIILHLRLNV